jgi:hypothetical protein
MRKLALATLAIIGTIVSAQAQTFGNAYPICLHLYGESGQYYECFYTSFSQCELTASGRPAQCVVNPYFAGVVNRPLRSNYWRSIAPQFE